MLAFSRPRWLATRMVVALLATSLMVSACGSQDDDGSSTAEDLATEPADGATSDEANAALGDGEAEPATIAEDEAPTDGAGAVFAPDLLPSDDLGASLWALVRDLHGPTDNLSRDLNRLAPFPPIADPAGGAFILDFGVIMEPSTSSTAPEGALSVSPRVRFLAAGSPADVLAFYEARFTADGWTATTTESGTGNSGPFSLIGFEKSDRGQRLTLEVFDYPDHSATLVSARFNDGANVDDELLRLARWSESLVPADGVLVKSSPGSSYFGEPSRVSQLGLSFLWEYERPMEEVVDDLRALAEASGHEVEIKDDGVAILDGPTGRVWIQINTRSLEVSIRDQSEVLVGGIDDFEGGGQAADAGQAVNGDASDELALAIPDGDVLGSRASADEIESVLIDLHGPTDDISSGMARLGPYPQLPTPANAEVERVAYLVNSATAEDGLVTLATSVSMATPNATVDEMTTFYETKLVAAGWRNTGVREEDGSDPGEKMITVTYAFAGVDADRSDPLTITVQNEVGGETAVSVGFSRIVAEDDAQLDTWLGWSGKTPLPDDGELTQIGVRTRRSPVIGGEDVQTMNLFLSLRYPDMDSAVIQQQVEDRVAASDYEIASEQGFNNTLLLTSSEFPQGEISFTSVPTKILLFAVQRELP